MRILTTMILLVGAVLLFSVNANVAQDKKEVVLKGLICCNKCELAKSKDCETVIVVKDENKKDVVHFFDAASHKKWHGDICTEAKKGSVTGTVKDVEKKKVVTVTKVAYD